MTSSEGNDNELMREMIAAHARKVYGMHIEKQEDLVAAFIARYGLDPAEATVVTHFCHETMTWRSWIERRAPGGRTF